MVDFTEQAARVETGNTGTSPRLRPFFETKKRTCAEATRRPALRQPSQSRRGRPRRLRRLSGSPPPVRHSPDQHRRLPATVIHGAHRQRGGYVCFAQHTYVFLPAFEKYVGRFWLTRVLCLVAVLLFGSVLSCGKALGTFCFKLYRLQCALKGRFPSAVSRTHANKQSAS